MAAVEVDEPRCRICFAGEEPGEPLVRPCRCSGTIAFVHRRCLAEWTKAKAKKKWCCEICGWTYWSYWYQHLPWSVVASGLGLAALRAAVPLEQMAAAAGAPTAPLLMVAAATLIAMLQT